MIQTAVTKAAMRLGGGMLCFTEGLARVAYRRARGVCRGRSPAQSKQPACLGAGAFGPALGAFDAVPGEKWQGIEEYAKKKREGGFVSTDPAIFTQLRQQAFSNPSEFANANLLAFRHRLNTGDFEQMVKLQESVKRAR